MSSLAIIRGLGGNGSTFLSRAIAAMDGVVLLSEVNPLSANLFGFALNPAIQIEQNYASLQFPRYEGHIAELGSPPLFGAYIVALREYCTARSLRLVVRDYNYADYIGTPFAWPPARRSSLDAALDDLPRNEILLIRQPVAQFRSLRSHKELERALDYRAFLAGYRSLLEGHPTAARFKYEDVFKEFDAEFRRIVDCLGLEFHSAFRSRLSQVKWVTGYAAEKEFGGSAASGLTDSDSDARLREEFLRDENYAWICAACAYSQ